MITELWKFIRYIYEYDLRSVHMQIADTLRIVHCHERIVRECQYSSRWITRHIKEIGIAYAVYVYSFDNYGWPGMNTIEEIKATLH